MVKNNLTKRYYAIPADLCENGNWDEIAKFRFKIDTSDKRQEIPIYASKVDWKELPSNLFIMSVVGVMGFFLSGGSVGIAIFCLLILAPSRHWMAKEAKVAYLDA